MGKMTYEELESEYIMTASILEAVEDILDGKEVSDFMESFPIVMEVKRLYARSQNS